MGLSEKDRDDARDVLKRGWLSIDQVTSIKDAIEKTGMSFREAATAKGLLSTSQVEQIGHPTKRLVKPEPAKTSSLYPFLLLTSISMIIAGGIYLYTWVDRRERLQAQETRNQRREADTLAQTSASRMAADFRRKKEEQRNRLAEEAREEIKKGEDLLKKSPKAVENPHFKKAANLYSQALGIFEDGKLLGERAHTYELWGAIPEAIADLEKATTLSPEKEEAFRKQIRILQEKLPKGSRNR